MAEYKEYDRESSERFIVSENIKHFAALLATDLRDNERGTVQRLLAEEKLKQASSNGAESILDRRPRS